MKGKTWEVAVIRRVLWMLGTTALVASMCGSAEADLLLYLDAAEPGADMSTDGPLAGTYRSWQDLSGNNTAFTNVSIDAGNHRVMYNPKDKAFVFNGDAYFLGSAEDEARFDFDTDLAKGVAGSGRPYTMVVCFKTNRFAPLTANPKQHGLLSKGKNWRDSGLYLTARDCGWLDLNQSSSAQPDLPGSVAARRLYHRTFFGDMTAMSLLVVTVDGTGTWEGIRVYRDGSVTPLPILPDYLNLKVEETVKLQTGDSILSDAPLAIGYQRMEDSGLEGEVAFVEVWDTDRPLGMTGGEFSAWRYNDGNMVRGNQYIKAVPEPPDLGSSTILVGLLICGALEMGWFCIRRCRSQRLAAGHERSKAEYSQFTG